MATTKVNPRFYAALAPSGCGTAPINVSALANDKGMVLGKASNLLAYQTYLAQCRAWKASKARVPAGFEREVLTHAQQALVDGRDLVTCVLRVTRQMKQTGRLDNLICSCAAAAQASGPVQVQDLWSDIAGNKQTRQLLRDQGLNDDIFAALDRQMRQVQGSLTTQGGRLVSVIGLTGQSTQTVTLSRSARGDPSSLDDLLHRGQFESVVEHFEQGGTLPFAPVPTNTTEVRVDDLVASAAVLAVQRLAQHVRKLDDTGLAVYAGDDPLDAIAVLASVGLVMSFIGLWIASVFCEKIPGGTYDQTGCELGIVLFYLGTCVWGISGSAFTTPLAALALYSFNNSVNDWKHGRI
jgi:hypothetical protein